MTSCLPCVPGRLWGSWWVVGKSWAWHMLTTNMVGGTKCEIHESMPMCNGVCVLCRQIWQMYFLQQKFTAVPSHLQWCFTCLAILSCSYISFLYLIELFNWKQFTGTLRLLQRPYLICPKQWPIFWPQYNWCFQFHVHVIQLDICFAYFFENTHPGWDSWVIKSFLSDPRDPITLSEDDCGVQSLPQQSS